MFVGMFWFVGLVPCHVYGPFLILPVFRVLLFVPAQLRLSTGPISCPPVPLFCYPLNRNNGECAERTPDVLQEMQKAYSPQGDAIQGRQGVQLCARQASV